MKGMSGRIIISAGIMMMTAGVLYGDYAQDYNTAIYFYKRGEHDLAAKSIEEIVSHYPAERRLDAALYWGAQSYERLGNPRDALRMYRRIVSDFPDSAYRIDALYAAGQSASDAGDYQEALALFGASAHTTIPATGRIRSKWRVIFLFPHRFMRVWCFTANIR